MTACVRVRKIEKSRTHVVQPNAVIVIVSYTIHVTRNHVEISQITDLSAGDVKPIMYATIAALLAAGEDVELPTLFPEELR